MLKVIKKIDVDEIVDYKLDVDIKIKDKNKIIEQYHWTSPTLIEILKLIWKLIMGWASGKKRKK